jgi:hypothetical protein
MLFTCQISLNINELCRYNLHIFQKNTFINAEWNNPLFCKNLAAEKSIHKIINIINA